MAGTSRLRYEILPHFGIRLDADLSAPMSPDERHEFRRLFLEHHLIIARDQTLTPEDRIRLMEYVDVGPILGGGEDAPISNVLAGGLLASHELSWHADNSNTEHPVKAISLYAVDLVDGASSTRFCSGSLAWKRLNADEQRRLLELEAFHVLSQTPDGPPRFDGDPSMPHSIKPVVLVDEFVGPVIYVHYNTTDSIVGVSRSESDAILECVYDQLYDPEFVYEHVWNLGDFLTFSNVALQHERGKLGDIGNRTLARVAVQEKSVIEMYPDYDFSRYFT